MAFQEPEAAAAASEGAKDAPSPVIEPPAAETSVAPVEQAVANPPIPDKASAAEAGADASAAEDVTPAQARGPPVAEVSAAAGDKDQKVALSVADLIQLHKQLSREQPGSPSLRAPVPEGTAAQEEAPAITAAPPVVPPPAAPQPTASVSAPAIDEASATVEQEAASQELPQAEAPQEQDADETPSAAPGAFRMRH